MSPKKWVTAPAIARRELLGHGPETHKKWPTILGETRPQKSLLVYMKSILKMGSKAWVVCKNRSYMVVQSRIWYTLVGQLQELLGAYPQWNGGLTLFGIQPMVIGGYHYFGEPLTWRDVQLPSFGGWVLYWLGGVIPSRTGCQSNNDQLIALHTPEKIEIELKNHPFAKEYHLNQTFLFGFQN